MRDNFISRKDFVDAVYQEAAIGERKDAAAYCAAYEKVLQGILMEGKGFTISGVGALKVADRPAKVSRNLRTGEAITIPPGRCVKFTQAMALKNFFRDEWKGQLEEEEVDPENRAEE